MESAVPVAAEVGPRSVVAVVMAATPRVLLAAVPVVTLGMLSFVPSLVVAARRRRASDWLVCAGFTAANVAWVIWAALTPAETRGAEFAADLLLVLLTTLGAAAHALFAGSGRRTSGPVAAGVK
ncbi:hypothetical protein AB0C40_13265 [Streptomyces brevispora]|uniref:Uncharacterized protein n=1 Tax=Streptomyces brevispora TaxID=887462 RepID=A0A561UW87_9ACTN|nr:hypothetical protein [Streptomyces brevispora]TWG03625.1 hypothetical protein FHX80_112059 [Streptomyces brevispora]WSC15332.1 hypothetical protein OIE64_22505 [Streptomyces brevispora]